MAGNKQVIWSPLAKDDFSNVIHYLLLHWNLKVANYFMEHTFDMIESIAGFPGQFPEISKELKIRKCVLTKQNSLYYRIERDHVEILRIFDSRQNPTKLIFD